MDALKAADYVTQEMERVFPLGCFKDRSSEEPIRPQDIEVADLRAVLGGSDGGVEPQPDPTFRERCFKFSGFGGQGVLSLGLVVAESAGRAGRSSPGSPATGRSSAGEQPLAPWSWEGRRSALRRWRPPMCSCA